MNYPPNWPPYFGGPPYYFNQGPQEQRAPSLEDLLAAENQIKVLKESIKKEMKDKDDKDKKKEYKLPSFSIGAVFGILSIGSIPFVLLQLMFLDWARTSVSTFLKVPIP